MSGLQNTGISSSSIKLSEIGNGRSADKQWWSTSSLGSEIVRTHSSNFLLQIVDSFLELVELPIVSKAGSIV